MIEISPEVIVLIMFGGVLVGVISGFPLAMPIGGVAVIVGFLLYGTQAFALIYGRIFSLITNYTLLAAPLFIFMGEMLERSGIAERMYNALYLWLGGLRGGLAIVTIMIGAVLAATVGIIAASITMLTLVALPAMIKRGYDKGLASGACVAGGCLGILIPPSVMLVLYGPMAMISVGKLFMAAFIPGFLLAGLYGAYIGIRCFVRPADGPPLPPEDRRVPFSRKTYLLVTAMAPTALLIVAVLGVIFLGIAAPTEAAASGAVVATLLAIAYRRFTLSVLKEALLNTFRLVGMILLIGASAYAFVGVFLSAGGGKVIEELILGMPGGKWGAFILIHFIVFILGFFIDWIGILFIVIPIVSPLALVLGFNDVWFALLICLNLQASFMTPPFAPGIFFLRGSADPELGVSMADAIRGVVPFIALVAASIALCIVFPEIILWLPGSMIH